MKSIKVPELIIAVLFFIGLLLVLMHDIEIDQVPEATITEVPLENNSEVESTI